MELDGYRLLPVGVKVIADNVLEMELYEGRNRQIRRMCQAVGLGIRQLTRIRIGELGLGDLPLGKWRYLTDDEVAYLYRSVKLKKGNE
jgi:pseudouridine synthase